MMDVSIIIVNYRTPQLTINCINSVIDSTRDILYEIIIVDNCSNDDSIEKIRKYSDKIILIESESNIGFGRANNLGAKIAKGKYLFLLNPDTIIHNNACSIFFNYFSNLGKEHNVGAIGCIMLDKDGKRNFLNSFNHFPSLITFLKDKLLTFLNLRRFNCNRIQKVLEINGELEVDYIVGADLFISSDLFHLLGGFDRNFFMYWEEVDLQYRMRSKGFVSKIISGPIISHLEGVSTSQKGNIWKRNQEASSLLLFVYLHYSRFTYSLFKIAFYLVFIFQFLRFKYSINEELEFLNNLNKK
jgi:GT2 family glycosyltransferase